VNVAILNGCSLVLLATTASQLGVLTWSALMAPQCNFCVRYYIFTFQKERRKKQSNKATKQQNNKATKQTKQQSNKATKQQNNKVTK
jgi:hypothetical protein